MTSEPYEPDDDRFFTVDDAVIETALACRPDLRRFCDQKTWDLSARVALAWYHHTNPTGDTPPLLFRGRKILGDLRTYWLARWDATGYGVARCNTNRDCLSHTITSPSNEDEAASRLFMDWGDVDGALAEGLVSPTLRKLALAAWGWEFDPDVVDPCHATDVGGDLRAVIAVTRPDLASWRAPSRWPRKDPDAPWSPFDAYSYGDHLKAPRLPKWDRPWLDTGRQYAPPR